MTAEPTLEASHTSTVTPDQIDDLGHMNVRWYGANAIAGSRAMCERLGLSALTISSGYTRHHHEQMEGAKLEVRSAVVSHAPNLRLYHELRNTADNDLAATFIHDFDHPALESPGIEIPEYGKARTLDLATNALASPPSLATLHELDAAMRLERQVTTEDTMGAERVPPWLANNLIWGGERPDGEQSWIMTADNGDQLAFASMETRFWINQLPTVGTRIQSFGAVVEVREKISHDVGWAYDLDSGEMLVAFEGIDLAFNITQRRAIAMTPAQRERETARLRPELAIR